MPIPVAEEAALAALQARDGSAVVRAFEREAALTGHPNAVGLAKGRMLQGDYAKAADLLTVAVDQTPQDVQARRLLGRALLAVGSVDFAEHELQTAMSDGQDVVSAREYLGALASQPEGGRRALYAALLISAGMDDDFGRLLSWAVVAQLDPTERAALPKTTTSTWPGRVAQFLAGTIDEAELWRHADAEPAYAAVRRCVAHYLLGEAALAGGGRFGAPNPEVARRHFQAAVATRLVDHPAYELADFMLDPRGVR